MRQFSSEMAEKREVWGRFSYNVFDMRFEFWGPKKPFFFCTQVRVGSDRRKSETITGKNVKVRFEIFPRSNDDYDILFIFFTLVHNLPSRLSLPYLHTNYMGGWLSLA